VTEEPGSHADERDADNFVRGFVIAKDHAFTNVNADGCAWGAQRQVEYVGLFIEAPAHRVTAFKALHRCHQTSIRCRSTRYTGSEPCELAAWTTA
jgi:hypothetical protein